MFHEFFIHNHTTPDPVLRASIVISMLRTQIKYVHESLDEPPNIPIITGGVPRGKRKRTSSSDAISGALIGAATAFTKYLVTDYSGNQAPSPSTPIRRSSTTVVGISPMSKAKLSEQYITQLQRLQGLLENNVLTPEEFAEEKTYALTNLHSLYRQYS